MCNMLWFISFERNTHFVANFVWKYPITYFPGSKKWIHSCLYFFKKIQLVWDSMPSLCAAHIFSKFPWPSTTVYSIPPPCHTYSDFKSCVCLWVLFILLNLSYTTCQGNKSTVTYYFHMTDIIYALSLVLQPSGEEASLCSFCRWGSRLSEASLPMVTECRCQELALAFTWEQHHF